MSASKQEIILKILTHHPADLLCTPQFHQKLQNGPSVLSVLCQVWFYQHKSHGALPGGGSEKRLASSEDRKDTDARTIYEGTIMHNKNPHGMPIKAKYMLTGNYAEPSFTFHFSNFTCCISLSSTFSVSVPLQHEI